MRIRVLIAVCLAALIPAPASAGPAAAGPTVVATGRGPTGYTVTFRYRGPAAKRVQIKGEWFFADPAKLAPNSTIDKVIETPAIPPQDWKPGMFPIQSPNTNAPNFPVVDMTRESNGDWTYTVPLPSGTFDYSFLVDCPGPACRSVADPANPSWSDTVISPLKSSRSQSQIYVPSDPQFGTIDYSWQAPSATPRGTLTFIDYATKRSAKGDARNVLTVYTPPGYDPKRAEPYPTLYLLHGRGDDELAWSTSGVAGSIFDNLIGTGLIRPMIVVMPNGTRLKGDGPKGYDQSPYLGELLDTIIPAIEARFRVSTSARDRAIAGLSQGSGVTNAMLVTHPASFAYFGSFSRGPSFALPTIDALPPSLIADLRNVRGVFVGAGWEEQLFPFSASMVNTLSRSGVAVTPDYVHGGHEWYVWRVLLRDFLLKVAFKPRVSEDCPACATAK